MFTKQTLFWAEAKKLRVTGCLLPLQSVFPPLLIQLMYQNIWEEIEAINDVELQDIVLIYQKMSVVCGGKWGSFSAMTVSMMSILLNIYC